MFDCALIRRVCMGEVFSGCVLPLKGLAKAPRASYHISHVSLLLPSPSHCHAFPHLVFLPLPPSLFIGVSFLRIWRKHYIFQWTRQRSFLLILVQIFKKLNLLTFESKSSDTNKGGHFYLAWFSVNIFFSGKHENR